MRTLAIVAVGSYAVIFTAFTIGYALVWVAG